MSLACDDEYSAAALPGPKISAEDTQCSNASASTEEQEVQEARVEGAVDGNDEDTDDEASRGEGLGNASIHLPECTQAKVEVEAATGPSAQLEGSAEEIQTQALMQTYNAKAVPQELLDELHAHIESAREKIMVQLDDLVGTLNEQKPQLEDTAGMLSAERESQARAANVQKDTQQRQASTLKNFFQQLRHISSIDNFL